MYIYIYYALKKMRKERRWWQTQLYTIREVYSGSSLLADLNFQSVSELYNNFTIMSPSEFEFLINLMGEKILTKDSAFRKPYMFKKIGRTRIIWLEDVIADLRRTGISGWMEKARNRDQGRGIVEEAKAHPGL
jgi:hypothetical protein